MDGVDVEPSVTVEDQDAAAGSVTVAEVVSAAAGWIVIHAEADGGPGPVIGWEQVDEGTNSAVMVEVDLTQATDVLYAMLHDDLGEVGVYEFPGDDAPAMFDGEMVSPSFTVTQ